MKMDRLLWCIVGFTPKLYSATLALQFPRFLLILASGLIFRALFNHLTADGPAAQSSNRIFWLLIALSVSTTAVRALSASKLCLLLIDPKGDACDSVLRRVFHPLQALQFSI